MNLFYANGTPIINSLKVTSEVPLDPRLTVENIAERDSLVTNHISYDRMKVYVKSNDTKYIYHKDTGEWEIDNKFSEEDKSKLDRIDNYLIDTEHIYNPENKLLYREHSYDPNTDITTLRDHILQEARVSENGELYNGLLSKFYVNRLNNITNYLIDVSFTKGTDVPNLYLTTHSYNPDEDKTTLTNIDIPLATDDNHGLLSNLQNIKVNRIVDYVNRIDTTHTNAPDTGLTYNYNIYNPFTNANVTKTILIPLVTHTENGLTSSSDKIKIDDIETYVKSIALRQASGTEELGIDYIITNPNDQTDTPGYFNIPLVTDSRNGLVSPARKHWMDNASGVSNTGTTSDTWQLDKKDIDTRLDPNGGVIIKDSGGIAEIRNSTDSAYSDLTLNNITIKGDVTLEGESFVTEAETVEIKDNLLLLNKGEVGAGVTKGIAGLEIDRGTEPNYFIIFDESDNRFKAGVEGDLWNLALRESDDNMLDGYFISWNSKDKILSTTNIVNESTPLLFGRTDYKQYSGNRTDPDGNYSSYAFISEAEGNRLYNFSGSSNWNIDTDKINFRFWKPLLGTTFKRASDNSEVLYHADIVNNLTSGGTNKVLSAEQGKLLQNSITSIQGSYLPLSGGTMTGSINLPSTDPLKMIISGSVDSVLSYWPSNNAIEFGNNKRKIFLRTDNSNIIHYINGSSYSIYDAYNLPDPVTLSGNNTFTGNNTFQEGKFNVGPFRVTSSGSLFLDISSQAESAWSRSITFRANSNPASGFIFGGFNLINDTSTGYAYIGIGDVRHDTAQYKFYSNQFSVSSTMVVPESSFRIFTGNSTLLYHNQSEKKVLFGSSNSSVSLELMANNLYHSKYDSASSTWKKYIIYSEYNLPNPATSTDLANYLPLAGGTLTGQLTIKQSVDIKLRLQSTDADNHCIIQAINSQASQLGVFGYAGDKWAIGHGGTYYEIWDKYNLTNPVRYALDASNYPTLLDSNGSSFSYIKAGPSGILPNTSVSLSSGGTGYCGTLYWSFKDGYFANVHTYKILIGPNETFIDSQSGDSNHRGIGFYTSQNAACPVYVGSLCVSDSYANDAPNISTNGIYSKGNIRTNGWISFTNNVWTDEGGAYKEENGSLKVLSVPTDSSQPKPSTYGSVLQFNSRKNHWCTQIWSDQVNSTANPSNGKLRYRTTKSYATTEWNPWTAIATEDYVGSNFLPLTGGNLTGKLSIKSSGSNLLILDSSSSTESVIHFLRSSTSKGAVGYYDNIGAFIYNFPSNTYLFVKDDGKPYVGTRTDYKKILTETDITGYATQTWVNNQGYLTSHQTIYNLTFQAGTFAAKTFDPNGAAATVNIPTKTSHITNDSGFITSSALNGYATQSWANGQFAPLSRFNTSTGYTTIKVTGQEFNFDSANPEIYINYRTLSGSTAVTKITWKGGSNSTLCVGRWGDLYMNDNLVATQSWAAEKFPNKTGAGASGTWGISITGNATTATTASKLGSTTIGGSAKPIYLSSGTPTACSATVGSTTVPVYMNAGTITQCSTTLGVSITGNAATATTATKWNGYSIWTGTEDELPSSRDANTLYFVKKSS